MIHFVSPSVRPMAIGSAAGLPRILGDRDFAARAFGFVHGEAGPGDLRIGEHDGGNGLRLERGRLAGKHFGRHLALVRRLVGEHRLARHVADRQDVRVGRLLLFVDDHEALLVDLHLRVFQADAGRDGAAADRDQHAVVR